MNYWELITVSIANRSIDKYIACKEPVCKNSTSVLRCRWRLISMSLKIFVFEWVVQVYRIWRMLIIPPVTVSTMKKILFVFSKDTMCIVCQLSYDFIYTNFYLDFFETEDGFRCEKGFKMILLCKHNSLSRLCRAT